MAKSTIPYSARTSLQWSVLIAVLTSVGFLALLIKPASAACHALSFSPNSYSVNENAGSVTITITRDGGLQEGSANYRTKDGSAAAGADYTSKSGRVDFAVTEESKTIQIPIGDDQSFEGDEQFQVEFNGGDGCSTSFGSPATVTIKENDPSPAAPPPPPQQQPQQGGNQNQGGTRSSPSPSPTPTPAAVVATTAAPSVSPTASPSKSAAPAARAVEDTEKRSSFLPWLAILGVVLAAAGAGGIVYLRRHQAP